MRDGFIKVGAFTPEIVTGDCASNAVSIIEGIRYAYSRGVRLLVLPELCVTGCTCGELLRQGTLLNAAWDALEYITAETRGLDMVTVLGLPARDAGTAKSSAAVISKGEIIDVLTEGGDAAVVYECAGFPDLTFSVETGSSLLSACDDSANIILCLAGEPHLIGADERLRTFLKAESARRICAVVYANAGEGESTSDGIYAGHNVIAENGRLLRESRLFENGLITADIDLGAIAFDRRRRTVRKDPEMIIKQFELCPADTKLERRFSKAPFIPENEEEIPARCAEIIKMQVSGLKKRLLHTGAKKLLLGISGGLDSTLALIAAAETMDALKRPRTDIHTVSMPCFGTSGRTRSNAHSLCTLFGTQFSEIDISEAVKLHLKSIGHGGAEDTAFENAQARERTQVLMDIANAENGIVIGTGDLSELALGWSTYNGDHMSMYGVNSSLPKTLIRKIVGYYAAVRGGELSEILSDILSTPVSPELLPGAKDSIAQKTEDIIGPYELHDFFLYHTVRHGCSPRKTLRMAEAAFSGVYDSESIKKWLKLFYRRFFSQQFKRSCSPDGVRTGSVCLSHGMWRMPADISGRLWIGEAERL